jgi:phosphoesterase RecJ-like protein
VAKEFGGGGHKNASGCTVPGSYAELRALFVDRVTRAIDRAEKESVTHPD